MSGPDFDSFLPLMQALFDHQARYVLVGGMAVNLHGLVRATEDIDLFIEPEPENISRVKAALEQVFEDPHIHEISSDDLCGNYPVVRYGPPDGEVIIDLIARLGELFRYEDLESTVVIIEGTPICLATPGTLFKMKRGTVRPRDHSDAYVLQQKFNLEP